MYKFLSVMTINTYVQVITQRFFLEMPVCVYRALCAQECDEARVIV